MRPSVFKLVLGAVAILLLGSAAAHGLETNARPAARQAKPEEVRIAVTPEGFVPSTVSVRKGVPIVLVVTRKTDQTCATQAVFPVIGKTVDLPLNTPVRVALPAQSAGRLSFACGMGMLHGELIVK